MPDVRRILPVPRDQAVDDASNVGGDTYIVANHNRWSRIALDVKDLSDNTWCELSFRIACHQEENAQAVLDFASVGVDFLTEDGSSVDFTYVPGLSRSQIDPHSYYIAGPAYHSLNSQPSRSGFVRFSFFIPAPARHLIIVIRSWRNTHPFTISDVALQQLAEGDEQLQHVTTRASDTAAQVSHRTWWALSAEPRWQRYGIVPGHPLTVRGQLINHSLGVEGALARIIFRDAGGLELAPPYDGVSSSPEVGAFIDIPIHRQTRRFTLDLTPPQQATMVELGFQTWRSEASISLATPLEVSIGHDLMLENILEEQGSDQIGFLEEVLRRLERGPDASISELAKASVERFRSHDGLGAIFTFHDRLRSVQRGEAPAIADGQLALAGFNPWSLPETLDWAEDPYKSPAWRLEFQSLSWLLDLAGDPKLGGAARAKELAFAWVEANPWGQPRDTLSSYPLSMADRVEVLLHLMSASATPKRHKSDKHHLKLFEEALRCSFALAELVSQSVFPPSYLQLRIACALFAVSEAIPHFPLAPYWRSIALAQLQSGFDQLVGQGGTSIGQSFHNRLEIVSIGLLLLHRLSNISEAGAFRIELESRLKAALKTIVAVTDPAGMLPPLGDVPLGYHHASWLRRLISGYGRSLLSDPQLAEELSYPIGSRTYASDDGIIVFREYERRPNWSYLCTSFGEQRHETGHFDCSSFVYTARGIRWITDPGGVSIQETGSSRHYLVSSRSHNVAIPDQREQSSGCGRVRTRRSLDGAKIVSIATNVYGPDYDHSRTILCLDDLEGIAVFDRFQSRRDSVSFDGFLHFEEETSVALASVDLAIGFRNRSRLRIIPHVIAGRYGGMKVINGCNRGPGDLQGFIAHPSGGLKPTNVLTYHFFGQGEVCGGVLLTLNESGLRRIRRLLAEQDLRELLSEPKPRA